MQVWFRRTNFKRSGRSVADMPDSTVFTWRYSMTMNVLTRFPYSRRYYLRHPLKFAKTAVRNVSDAAARVKLGYCSSDVWDMCDYLMEIIPSMLVHFVSGCDSYPDTDEFPTYESWIDYIVETASIFREASEAQTVQVNQYKDDFMNMMRAVRWEKNVGGNLVTTYDLDSFARLRDDYFSREREIEDWRNARRNEAFARLSHILRNLWD